MNVINGGQTVNPDSDQKGSGLMNNTASQFRASAPFGLMTGDAQFGPLINLAGTWMGKGFNLVSVPQSPSIRNDPNNPNNSFSFIPKIGTTREVFVVAPLGAPIPNRGFTHEDDTLFGLSYLQVVTDAISSEGRHFESGLWLNVPDAAPPNVIRQGALPHGNSFLARGTAREEHKRPDIPPISSKPIQNNQQITDTGYLEPFRRLVLPQESPSLPQGSIDDPNEVLRQQIQPQNITNTITIEISTIEEGGGILNIPSLKENGEATTMRATFWIETVEPEGQVPFVQLQYSHFVMLRFENIDWPHISVATLIRQ